MRFNKKQYWPIGVILLALAILAASLGGSAQAAQLAETPTPASTLSPTSTGTQTPGHAAINAATPTPLAPRNIVISEFRTRGPKGDKDEFIELYNPTGAPVNLGSWLIKRSADCGTASSGVTSLPSNL